jgi:hypothetical protein
MALALLGHLQTFIGWRPTARPLSAVANTEPSLECQFCIGSRYGGS